MATDLQREQRELAEFIRVGSTRGPQCFGSYFDEKGGSCASARYTRVCITSRATMES